MSSICDGLRGRSLSHLSMWGVLHRAPNLATVPWRWCFNTLAFLCGALAAALLHTLCLCVSLMTCSLTVRAGQFPEPDGEGVCEDIMRCLHLLAHLIPHTLSWQHILVPSALLHPGLSAVLQCVSMNILFSCSFLGICLLPRQSTQYVVSDILLIRVISAGVKK